MCDTLPMAVLPIDTPRLHLRVMRLGRRRRPGRLPQRLASRPLPGLGAAVHPRASPRSAGRPGRHRRRRDPADGCSSPSSTTANVVGDVAVGIARLGHRRARLHAGAAAPGKGYASEAAEAVVDARVRAPPTCTGSRPASTPRTSPRCACSSSSAFSYEGLARRSELIRGEWVDDLRFAMLRDDRAAWRARPRHRPASVELVEITPARRVPWAGSRPTIPTAVRRTRASLVRRCARPRGGRRRAAACRGSGASMADGERVGFVMMAEVTEHHPQPYLWRLLIDRVHQRRGIGIAALRQLIDAATCAQGRTQLLVSYVEAPGGPEPFYRRLGFVPTGEMDDDETIAAAHAVAVTRAVGRRPAAAAAAAATPTARRSGPAAQSRSPLLSTTNDRPSPAAARASPAARCAHAHRPRRSRGTARVARPAVSTGTSTTMLPCSPSRGFSASSGMSSTTTRSVLACSAITAGSSRRARPGGRSRSDPSARRGRRRRSPPAPAGRALRRRR